MRVLIVVTFVLLVLGGCDKRIHEARVIQGTQVIDQPALLNAVPAVNPRLAQTSTAILSTAACTGLAYSLPKSWRWLIRL
jgi:ABC-type antimicrobial peptide transport system permease subunit